MITIRGTGSFTNRDFHWSVTGAPPLRSAIQTVLIGGLAAAVAFMIARAIS
jgi:hypothetical protein